VTTRKQGSDTCKAVILSFNAYSNIVFCFFPY
jgi:hypothetical protein